MHQRGFNRCTDGDALDENIDKATQRIESEPLEKKREIPTWADIKSYYDCCQNRSLLKSRTTLTGIIAPVLRTSPKYYTTLCKALCLTKDISAVVTGQLP